jgi:drug/metabolite transporter (DMT)-like permease
MSFWDLYSDSIVKSVSNGELLMYAAATLGPTFYLAFKFMKTKKKPFPWVRPQLLIAFIISLTSATLFFTSRDYGFASEESFIFLTSVIYVLTLTLLFPSMAFEREEVRKPEEATRKSEVNFMAGYKNHRSDE